MNFGSTREAVPLRANGAVCPSCAIECTPLWSLRRVSDASTQPVPLPRMPRPHHCEPSRILHMASEKCTHQRATESGGGRAGWRQAYRSRGPRSCTHRLTRSHATGHPEVKQADDLWVPLNSPGENSPRSAARPRHLDDRGVAAVRLQGSSPRQRRGGVAGWLLPAAATFEEEPHTACAGSTSRGASPAFCAKSNLRKLLSQAVV